MINISLQYLKREGLFSQYYMADNRPFRMFSLLARSSKLFLESVDALLPPLPLKASNTPKFSISLLLSLLYYILMLLLIYSQLGLIFETPPPNNYIPTPSTSLHSIEYRTNSNIQITYRSVTHGDQSRGTECEPLLLFSRGEKIKFQRLDSERCTTQEGKKVVLEELYVNYQDGVVDAQIQYINITIKGYKTNEERTIAIDCSRLNQAGSNYLRIVLDLTVDLSRADLFPWTEHQENPGVIYSPRYSVISTPTPTHRLIEVTSSQTTYLKLPSSLTLSNILCNISCIISIFYLLSLVLSRIPLNNYLELASRFYILKYNENNQLIYQNINPHSSLQCSKTLSSSLSELAIQRTKQKLDVTNIIKQLKNVEVLLRHHQNKSSMDHLKRTITTINPYELTSGEKHKILEYIQLEDIDIGGGTHNIFSSPLAASIAYRLTYSEQPHFTQSKIEEDPPADSKLVNKKQGKGIMNRVSMACTKILQNLDIFAYRIGFYFDQQSSSLQSSLLGFMKSLRLWLVLLFSFSYFSRLLSSEPQSFLYSLSSASCNRSLTIPPLYMFLQNSTSGKYLSFQEINYVASISIDIQNSSYALKPVGSQLDHLPEWRQRGGGVYQLESSISSCGSSMEIELEYKCPSNTNCNQHMYNLFDLNIYLLLPQSDITGSPNTLQHKLTPYKFNYEYHKARPKQIITLQYIQEVSSTDSSLFTDNHKSQSRYKLSPKENIAYSVESSPSSVIRFELSSNVVMRYSQGLQIDELVGSVGAIWILFGLSLALVQNYVRMLVSKIELVKKREAKWVEVLGYIFTRPFWEENLAQIDRKGEDVMCLEKLVSRISVAENSITSFQSSGNRVMLNTYLKQELQPFYSSLQKNTYSDLPDISFPSPVFRSHNIENAIMNHHPTPLSNKRVKRVYNHLNKMNIFWNEPSINFSGKTHHSSKITKLFSVTLLCLLLIIVYGKVERYPQNHIIRQQPFAKAGDFSRMSKEHMEKHQFCIRFRGQFEVEKRVGDIPEYFQMRVEQDGEVYALRETEDLYWCVEERFKEKRFASNSPFHLTLSPAKRRGLESQESTPNGARFYSYSVCMTSYSNTVEQFNPNNNNGGGSDNQIIIGQRTECSKYYQVNERVNTIHHIGLRWNTNKGTEYYSLNWGQQQEQYSPRSLSEPPVSHPYSTFQFSSTPGHELVIQQPSYFKPIQQILGVVLIITTLIPLGRRYNEIQFVLKLSGELFVISGASLEPSALDTLRVVFLSVFKIRKLMNKRNRVLMRSYLQTRRLLSYKHLVSLLESVEEKLKLEYSPEFQVLLRTYIKPEIFLEENIDLELYQEKTQALKKLKQLHGRFYGKAKGLGLSDDEILQLTSEMQNEEFINNQEVRRRVEFFKEQIGVK